MTRKKARLPKSAEAWDEETRTLGYQLMGVGVRWGQIRDEQRELSRARTRLYVEMEQRGVTHATIAELAGSSKGAVEQALNAARRQGAPPNPRQQRRKGPSPDGDGSDPANVEA